jgi:molybdenum cofactor synthesis domain-containing protein
MGKIDAICTSERKGERKRPVPKALLIENYGIDGDAHAGPWHRQVSLLTSENVDQVRRSGMSELKAGDFAENILISGIDLSNLGLGSRLKFGPDAELSITQIGKSCHNPCIIQKETGDCIMPKLGLFARVIRGGSITNGDAVDVVEMVPRSAFQAVALTISDRCSRNEAIDTAGPAVAKLLVEHLKAHVYKTEILPDDRQRIAERLKHYCDGHSIDIVVTAGGTGFSPRDVTPEAVAEVIDRPTPGLDEAMRRLSGETTQHAMLSRGISGIRGATLVVSLPGSERAALENLQAILPALGHGLSKLRGDPSDCAPRREESS